MTDLEFERRFDSGDLDCEFAMFISERYDAWDKHRMLSYWEDPDAYQEFKDSMIKKPSKVLQNAYFGGSNPLDKFPTMWGDKK